MVTTRELLDRAANADDLQGLLKQGIGGTLLAIATALISGILTVADVFLVPMRAADSAILVTTPHEVAIEDTRKMVELAETVDTGVLGAVVTRARSETDVPALADELGVTALAAVPNDRQAARNEPVVVNEPETYAAQAYRTLAQKLGNYVEARTTA